MGNGQARAMAAVAVGGAAGSLARYGLSTAWPTRTGAFPWTTLVINVVGSAVLCVLVVLFTEVYRAHPLARPFLGTGVLGGFTTFSTYAVDALSLAEAGRPLTAGAYLAATLLGALAGGHLAIAATRRLAGGVPA